MADIHVCSLSRFTETLELSQADHVASLINANMEVPYPLRIPLENRLFLGFNDIVDEVPGFIQPEKIHAEKLIGFVRQWDQKNAMVIHCWMGVSRSTAGAYITQCALMPERSERELAATLRAASPEATPNMRLITFGDELLGRDGRMIEAIREIGRGAETYEGIPFSLSIS